MMIISVRKMEVRLSQSTYDSTNPTIYTAEKLMTS
jgi:hypothetical protein